MQELDLLKDLVVVLGAAVIVVAVLRRVGIPSVAGFILTGVLAGPTALRLVDHTHQVEVLAEIGVVLLLFGIGLELSLQRLRRLWKVILLGGGFQVAVTIACAAGVASWFGLAPGAALFLGCVVAVSSTAIVLQGLSRRRDIDAPHGRLAVGILVFQDLCVVPMILAVPFLAGRGGSTGEVLSTIGTAVAILAGVLVAASLLVPRILAFVARTRERDLFILTVFLVCFGTAWAASLAGISLALGAFLAGLVVAGSEFRHQALTDLIPAREVLAGLFFVSIGMFLDISDVLEHLMSTVGLLAAILAGKAAIILGTALILRLPLRVGILSAATLCQVGEFSFVLLKAASGTELLSASLSHNLLVAIILSMLLTPMAIAFGPHLASSAARVPWLNRLLGVQPPGVDAQEPHSNHVVLAGYGPAGRAVCQALRTTDVAYVAVDMNPDNVRAARNAGDRVVFGDVTQREVLEELGCKDARLVVLGINDASATELATRTIREFAPDVAIIVRTPYELDKDALRAVGATQVVTAEIAASDALVSATLAALPIALPDQAV
jgi:CPA2 family monovalent cation:H+ antiporter-2